MGKEKGEKMKICFLGEYDPESIFNRVPIKGLKENGAEIVEWNVKGKRFGFFPKVKKLFHILKARKFDDVDLFYVGFPARWYFIPAKIVCFLTKKPLVIDFFLSDFLIRKHENNLYAGRLFSGCFDFYKDYLMVKMADIVLCDNPVNIEWFSKTFSSNKKKWVLKPFGESTDFFKPLDFKKSGPFVVLYFCSFIPAHNVPLVLEVAKMFEEEKDIEFTIVGDGIEKSKALKKAKELCLSNVHFFTHVRFNLLQKYLSKSDVVLAGHFGSSQKALNAVTTKVYTGMASRKPVIVGDNPANRWLFKNVKDSALFVKPGDKKDLFEAIYSLKNNVSFRKNLSNNAYDYFSSNFTPKIIGKDLLKKFEDVIKSRKKKNERGKL
jgi:glycosyltransferase involved in cell wall biosynthesis